MREYRIADAVREAVTVYDFAHNEEAAGYAFSERVKAGIFEDLYLLLSEMEI